MSPEHGLRLELIVQMVTYLENVASVDKIMMDSDSLWRKSDVAVHMARNLMIVVQSYCMDEDLG